MPEWSFNEWVYNFLKGDVEGVVHALLNYIRDLFWRFLSYCRSFVRERQVKSLNYNASGATKNNSILTSTFEFFFISADDVIDFYSKFNVMLSSFSVLFISFIKKNGK